MDALHAAVGADRLLLDTGGAVVAMPADPQCVAATARGVRCRNPVTHGQVWWWPGSSVAAKLLPTLSTEWQMIDPNPSTSGPWNSLLYVWVGDPDH